MSEKIKQLLSKDKKTSNLILILILLVTILIASNYIFDEDKNISDISKETISKNVVNNENQNLEEKLSGIISKIEGIETADVLVTYSTTEKIMPVYDTKEDVNTTNDGTKKTVEKTVAYESEGSTKSAIVQSKESAVATGAIVVVSGSVTENIKGDIKAAVSMVTDVPLHKIQIFINK